MPIMQCSEGGKSGYKWGESGKCYIGAGGREKALTQMRAIKASQHRAGM